MSEITKIDQNLSIKKIDRETLNIQINDNEMLMSIVGQFDQNLKDLSKIYSCIWCIFLFDRFRLVLFFLKINQIFFYIFDMKY